MEIGGWMRQICKLGKKRKKKQQYFGIQHIHQDASFVKRNAGIRRSGGGQTQLSAAVEGSPCEEQKVGGADVLKQSQRKGRALEQRGNAENDECRMKQNAAGKSSRQNDAVFGSVRETFGEKIHIIRSRGNRQNDGSREKTEYGGQFHGGLLSNYRIIGIIGVYCSLSNCIIGESFMKAMIHANAILPNEAGDFYVREDTAILYDEIIRDILPMREFKRSMADEILDAQGNYVSPGFINIHVHGCMGCDTMDEDGEALPIMRRFQASTGVTAFLPTTMTYDMPRIHRALERVRGEMKRDEGARVLGAHMEGPFIHPQYAGAQAAEQIQKADFDFLRGYEDVISVITLAPEELEEESFLRECRAAGIVLSLGHSAADYETAVKAIREQGISHITHLFNAQTGFHHRRPGIVGAAFDTDAVCELIADNVHSHPAAQRLTWRLKGSKRLVLITDSLRACGLGDGPSELGGQQVTVKGMLATLADGTIAGSVATMDRILATFLENTGAELPEVIETVTKTPAGTLGYGELLGEISVGKAADFAVFNKDICIFKTIVKGKQIYCRNI